MQNHNVVQRCINVVCLLGRKLLSMGPVITDKPITDKPWAGPFIGEKIYSNFDF